MGIGKSIWSKVQSLSRARSLHDVAVMVHNHVSPWMSDRRSYQLYEIIQRLFGYRAARDAFREETGLELDLRNPVTCAEKIHYLKLFHKDPILPIITDKVRVRPWVAERIGEQFLIPLLGVYESPDEIDLAALPDKNFVIKINFDSGRNIIVRDKRDLDWLATKAMLARWLKTRQHLRLMEWNHHEIPPRILIEELLLDEDGRIPPDYKFEAFKGEIHYIYRREMTEHGRFDKYYTTDWQPMILEGSYRMNAELSPKPEKIPEMIEIVRALAWPFPYLRVDLYSMKGRVYFGEMTPHPGSGIFTLRPEEYNKLIGDLIDVSEVRPPWAIGR